MKKILLGATALAMTIGPAGVWSMQNMASAAAGDDFSCRASVVRVDPDGPLNPIPPIEPFVANELNDPCVAEDTGILNNQDLGGLANASVVFANTESRGTPAAPLGSTANAGVVDLTLTVPGLPVIRAEVLTATANAGECDASKASPKLSGSSQVAALTIDGERFVLEDELGLPESIPLGPNGELGTLFLNQQTTTDNEITQRALHLDTPLVDVVIAEAIADFDGNPCDQGGGGGGTPTPTPTNPPPGGGGSGPPQCSDEVDNDGDGLIDFPNDPGCESPQDDNETDGPPAPECSDGVDNDNDGDVDYPADPGCENRDDDDETNNDNPECSDTVENDGDGTIDHPADTGCTGPEDDDEAAGFITGGGGYEEIDKKTLPEDFVNPGNRLRFSASLSCDLGENKDHLGTTWFEQGQIAQFKLQELTRAFCRNDPFIDEGNPNAEFETYYGEGTGDFKLNGVDVPLTRAEFILIDRGEPGSPPVIGVDFYEIRVYLGVVELATGVGTLDEGNIQSHTPPGQFKPAPTDGGTTGGKGGKGRKA